MNKYIVLFALLALAASAFALSLPIDKKKLKFPKVPKCFCIRAPCNCGQWDEESDIAWVPVGIWAAKAFGAGALGAAGKHAYDKFIRRKDAQESDIAWVPAAIWAGKAIGAGALGAAGAHAYDKIFRRGKRDSVESDLSIGTLVAAYNLYKKFKKDNVASDADFKFLKKIGGIAKKGFSLYQKAKGLGFFADKFNFKKIGSIAKKGFETYKKIKGLGFFDDAESDKEFRDALVAKLKDRVKDKLKSQLKDGGKKLCVLTKLRAKPFCAARTKVESDKINWKNLFSQKNLEKAVGIYKAIKGGESVESDAEFLKKLKKWWDEKGKGLFEKGKNLFNKGKEIYAILKNKSAPESDKIDWSKVKKYLTPENLQKAVDIWKVLKNKDATESDFYGQVAQWLGKKAVEQAGKFGYNKIFRRKDEAEEQAPAEKPAKKQKKAAGVTLKGLVAKLRKQRAQENNKDGKKKFNFKNLLSKVQKLRSEKKQSKDGEKPKRKFDIKSLIAKIAKKRAEKKQKKEKKVEEPQQVNDQASG